MTKSDKVGSKSLIAPLTSFPCLSIALGCISYASSRLQSHPYACLKFLLIVERNTLGNSSSFAETFFCPADLLTRIGEAKLASPPARYPRDDAFDRLVLHHAGKVECVFDVQSSNWYL